MERSPSVRWQAYRFQELDANALYDLLKLRAEVFVVEQNCVYLDPDGMDRHPRALHLLGRVATDELAACLRILPPGVAFPQVSIGRVATAKAFRGRGLGDPLLHRALREIELHWPGADVQIGAQAHLQEYYGRHGFAPCSSPYLEDGIPHIHMLRSAAARSEESAA